MESRFKEIWDFDSDGNKVYWNRKSTNEEKLNLLLQRLSIPFDYSIPVFIGKMICKIENGDKKLYVSDIRHCSDLSKPINNPYYYNDAKPLEIIYFGKQNYSDLHVVFIPSIGRLFSKNELLSIDTNRLKVLNADPADYPNIINEIIKWDRTIAYSKELRSIFDHCEAVINVDKQVQQIDQLDKKIQSNKDEIKRQKRSIEENNQKLNKQRNELATQIEGLNEEIERLKAERQDNEEKAGYKKVIEELNQAQEELKESEQKNEDLKVQNSELDSEITTKKSEKEKLSSEIDELETGKGELEKQKDEMQAEWNKKKGELNKIMDKLKIAQEKVEELRLAYSSLSDSYASTDISYTEECKQEDSVDLEKIKSRLKYNYSNDKIQRFLMALTTSQIIALCGDPGTGKSTFARQMADALGAKFHMIDVQNNWTDKSDIFGFYNPTNGEYQSSELLDAIIEAHSELVAIAEYNAVHKKGNKNKEKEARLHIICLDEMNLARVEYYFATFLSLLQQDKGERLIKLLPYNVQRWIDKKREIEALKTGKGSESKDDAAENASSENKSKPKSKKAVNTAEKYDEDIIRYSRFIFPSNVRFVGTLNMDDTAQFLSPKVLARCFFIEFDNNEIAEPIADYKKEDLKELYFPASLFEERFDKPVGYDEFETINGFWKSFEKNGYRVSPRLKNYSYCMFPMYKEILHPASDDTVLNEEELKEYMDLIILSKVLPEITKRSSIDGMLDDYEKSEQRFEDGCDRGESNHPNDTESWSFWE